VEALMQNSSIMISSVALQQRRFMPGNPYALSLEAKVLSADPVELVCLLYRGAIDAVEQARQELRAGNIESRGRAITKAMDILSELIQSLDRKQGGEFALTLLELYDYIQKLLHAAHRDQSGHPLDEAGRLLNTLLQGWEACGRARKAASAGDSSEELALMA
jgi:flagellar protein FliS